MRSGYVFLLFYSFLFVSHGKAQQSHSVMPLVFLFSGISFSGGLPDSGSGSGSGSGGLASNSFGGCPTRSGRAGKLLGFSRPVIFTTAGSGFPIQVNPGAPVELVSLSTPGRCHGVRQRGNGNQSGAPAAQESPGHQQSQVSSGTSQVSSAVTTTSPWMDGSGDDDDRDFFWHRRKTLIKSHYFDVEDFGGNWDEYIYYLENCPLKRKLKIDAQNSKERTCLYQKAGLLFTASGLIGVAAITHGARRRRGLINLPWWHIRTQATGNVIPASVQSLWPVILAAPLALLSQFSNFNLISIPKRHFLKKRNEEYEHR